MPPFPYRHRAVRDLAWACFSPPLLINHQLAEHSAGIANTLFSLSDQRRHWLETLDRRPGPLLEFLAAAKSQRLGLYFERLWQFFLREDTEVELLANNLPVRDGGRTLGEFDCLYFCRRRRLHIHLELAVKYYLGYGSTPPGAAASNTRQWLGPNNRDRLDIKIERLLGHQIRLSESPHAQPSLRELGIDTLSREVEVKGYLFQPDTTALAAPQGFNPAASLCHWHRFANLAGALNSRASYLVLPRLHWLGPTVADSTEPPLTAAQLLAALERHFAAQRRARLVAELDSQGLEQQRFFVVDANWPV